MANPLFFTKNRLRDNCTFTFTSALESIAGVLYDRDRTTTLESVGSDDVTPEVWDIEFSAAQDIDTLIVDAHNIKSGGIQYWNGATFVAFSTPATWSSNALATSVFSFNTVSTTKIRITMNTTFVVDAQKTVGLIYAMATIGQPSVGPATIDREFVEDSRSHKKSSGGVLYVYFGARIVLKYLFTDSNESDVSLFSTLKNLDTEFFIWPCGSVASATVDVSMRVYDLYLVNYVNNFKPDFKSNILGIGSRISIDFKEV
jgi:hypothetical protein